MSESQQQSLLSHEGADTSGSPTKVDISTDNRFDGLGTLEVWAYGVGHFVNDLCAACWFNYLLYFLNKVVETEAAPAAIFAGQIVDGFATPVVGALSDKTTSRFGQRKPWYVFGLVLVLSGYLPLYSGFTTDDIGTMYAFYVTAACVLNIGWASLQISHMSLVPSITCSRKRRDKLNNLRNLFTFISNFAVLGMGLIIFSTMHDRKLEYKVIAYTMISMGVVASIFFIKVIDEPTLVNVCHEKQEALKKIVMEQRAFDKSVVEGISEASLSLKGDEEGDEGAISPLKRKESIMDWFKMPKFYLFGVCYMSVRLYTNLFGTILPFYLTDVLNMSSGNDDQVSYTIALVPMLAYGASVAMSSQLNKFYSMFGRKKALFLGTAICLASLAVMAFLTPNSSWVIYILSFFIGASQSLVLATGINLISDVVGNKGKSGAFVFGIYSLLDKFSSGIAIFVVGTSEAFNRKNSEITEDDRSFIRLAMILIPGVSCLLASLIVLSYPIEEYGKSSKKNDTLIDQKSTLEEELVS